ncbi:hypothetical protein HHX47_DHR3000949 [Lentinula edodes]|nr:hypothetical protein HHX47_DHR3000949 [Lentinula edodes]
MPMYGFAHNQVFPQPPVSTSGLPVQPVQNPTLGKKNSSQQPNTVPGHLSAADAGLNTVPSINIVPPTPVLGSVVLPSQQTAKSTSPSEYQLAGKKNPLLSPNTTPESWDGWLDGNLEADFTWEELAQTGDLRVHWARKDYGSRAGVGNAFAEHWSAGKKNTRSCLGGGKHWQNIGFHNHQRITHILHLLPGEQTRFEELIDINPDTTPSQLLVGRRTLHGKQKSASDISPVYNNRDRIAKDRQKVINGAKYSGGDSFVSGFRDFHRDFPGFIVHTIFGEINMICLQSEFMRSRLGGMFKHHQEPVNGIVSDAAHGFWRERNSLLITSSIYEAELHCWVPGLFSYSDGASAEHYMHHFLVLMLSIAHECEANDTIIADRHFAGIIDFSQAERHGFIQAFVAFWMQRHENTRSEDTLYSAAEVLLRGCEEHFRASVTRIKKIHGVVPVHSEKHFEELVLGLISAKDLDDFHARVEVIQRDFPLTNSWLGWWLRESNARMLFETHTRMEPDIWTSIPNTTNAQEAQHWKLYSAVGRDHGLLEGLEALHAVAETTVKLFTANLEGGLIRYGKAEPWKAMINLIGRSKPSRAPGGRSTKQKSDGRPPDTKKDLLSRTPKKSKELPSTHHTNSAIVGPASYRWDNMSCWADSAWDLLYRSIVKDWASFSSRFSSDSQTERPIRDFYNLMLLRRNAEHDSFILKVPDYDLSTALSSQRDQFRRRLVEWRIIKSDNAVGNAFDWFPQVLKDKLNDDLDDDNWTQSYFQTMFVTIKHCSGDGNGHHYQVCQKPEIRYLIVLRQAACQEFKGDLLSWLQTFANVNHSPQALPTCWRARDGESWCKGSQTDVKFILSLPVVLILEEEECTTSTEFWNFPALLQPYKSGELATVTYDIVGRIFYSRSKNHYISRFLDEDGKTVWTYDDMAHGGCPYVEPGATAGTHLTGSSSTLKLPSDFIGAFAIYHLRNGTSTQEAIYTSQLAVARRVHHMMVEPDSLRHHVPKIWLSRVKFAQLTPHDLTWLKNPFRLDTLDYQETTESSGTIRIPPRSTLSYQPNHESSPFLSSPTSKNLLEPNSVSPQEQDQMHSVETLDHGLNVDLIEEYLQEGTSDFQFMCRCGITTTNETLVVHNSSTGDIIQCDNCDIWSHIACQKEGRAGGLRQTREPFQCDGCAGNSRAIIDSFIPGKR